MRLKALSKLLLTDKFIRSITKATKILQRKVVLQCNFKLTLKISTIHTQFLGFTYPRCYLHNLVESKHPQQHGISIMFIKHIIKSTHINSYTCDSWDSKLVNLSLLQNYYTVVGPQTTSYNCTKMSDIDSLVPAKST